MKNMDNLAIMSVRDVVFLEPNKIDAVPFTTSDVVAEFAQVSYRSIQRTIERNESDLASFGRVRFQITPFETKGGIQEKKIYHLNEEQATLLVTYLKNTEPVRLFKKELVRQFYAMRDELMKRRGYRVELKPIRREMTDVIQIKEPDNKWAYKLYTDLAYKAVTGRTAAQLRKERNAPQNAIAIDYMTSEEIRAVTNVEYKIGVLLELGMNYYQIKGMLTNALLRIA